MITLLSTTGLGTSLMLAAVTAYLIALSLERKR